jgi:hypothetical protein
MQIVLKNLRDSPGVRVVITHQGAGSEWAKLDASQEKGVAWGFSKGAALSERLIVAGALKWT